MEKIVCQGSAACCMVKNDEGHSVLHPIGPPPGYCRHNRYSSGLGTSQLHTQTDIPSSMVSFIITPYLPSPWLNSSGQTYPQHGLNALWLHPIEEAPKEEQATQCFIHLSRWGDPVNITAGPPVMWSGLSLHPSDGLGLPHYTPSSCHGGHFR